MMRLFVALAPPDAALDEIEAAVARQRAGDSALRWVARERWHVTLAFLGDVGEEQLQRLRPGLRDAAAERPPLELSFAGAGAFPRTRRGRVLWIGMQGDLDELGRLATSVADAARRSDIEQEKRKFSAHMTLARSKEATDLSSAVEPLTSFEGTPWTAEGIHLVRSHLGPKPQYETLETWPLGAGVA